MWMEEFLDSGKNPLALLLCIFLPLTVTVASQKLEATVMEFRVFRLQQFDYHGNLYGSRGWRVSYEAVGVGSKNKLRRCLVVWWKDLVGQDLQSLLQPALGSVLIVLPSKDSQLSSSQRESIMSLEEALLAEPFTMPVYFAQDSPPLTEILSSLLSSQLSQELSAFSVMMQSVTANSFQLVSGNQASSVKIETPLYNIVGKLSAYERGSSQPTIAIVAHYDAFGAAPGLSFGADSNGSGVAALLELARLFNRLYHSSKTRARYNVLFILSAAGKINFQGSKQWIEEFLEQNEGSPQLEFALCLDSIGRGEGLNVHVSKLPKENSPIHRFVETMKESTETRFKGKRNVSLVQKKINLAEEFLAWEHERYNIRKLRAFTISHQESHKDKSRRTILDTREGVDIEVLEKNVQVLADALQRQIYRVPGGEEGKGAIFSEGFVQRTMLESWMGRLTSAARSAQSMSEGAKDPIVAELLNSLEHHTHQASLVPVQVDKKDPDFVLYGGTVDRISVHKVKPAVFDLLLAGFIAAYLGLLYYGVLNIHSLLSGVRTLSSKAVKVRA